MNTPSKSILLAIDKIPWPDITHAYGPANDVPELILAITSCDDDVRNKAWHQLHGNLWHQGSVYEATAYAVPLFLELLKEPTVPSKHRILGYLALLFTGRSYWDVHQHLRIAQDMVKQPGFQAKLENEVKWVEATKQAVTAGKDVYVAILQGDTSGARIGAAYLLGLIHADDLETIEEVIKSAEQSP